MLQSFGAAAYQAGEVPDGGAGPQPGGSGGSGGSGETPEGTVEGEYREV